MQVFSYELLHDGESHTRGTVTSDCDTAEDFYRHLANRPYPTTDVHIRVWAGESMAGHPAVDRPRRRLRSLIAVTS